MFLTQKRRSSAPTSVATTADPYIVSPKGSVRTPGAPGQADDLSDLNLAEPVPILIRATNGRPKEHQKDRVKVSTVVKPDELETFFTRYAEVCKSGMSGLRKRDRSGAKAKAKAKAKKRKEAEGEKK